MLASLLGTASGFLPGARCQRCRRSKSRVLQASKLMNALYSIRSQAVRRIGEPSCPRRAALQQPVAHTGSAATARDSGSGDGSNACSSSHLLVPYRTSGSRRSGRKSCNAEPSSQSSGADPLRTPQTEADVMTDAAGPAASAAESEAARRGLASMAQLASAWAQVSSRLGPAMSLDPADGVAESTATVAAYEGSPLIETCGAVVVPHASDSGGGHGGGGITDGGETHGGSDGAPASGGSRLDVAEPQHGPPGPTTLSPVTAGARLSGQSFDGATSTANVGMALSPALSERPWAGASDSVAGCPQQPSLPPQQGQYQREQQQQQPRPHFEAIITALKLALASLQTAPPRRDGRSPATRAVQLASTLADLCAAGLPLDAASMCAGVVAEAADMGALRHDVIGAQLGPGVAGLVHDMLRVRQAPRRIELLDDEGASAVREWCLAFHDVRACVVEVVSWWDELQHMGGLPLFEQQALALEALQIGAPLGHALGLGALSSVMEDMCLKVLFPESYASTSAWLRGLMDPAEDALFAAQQRLLAALDIHPDFGRCAGGLVVKARTKSLFSVMKKLLHLGNLARGGRSREELYDLLGMRAVVKPPDFLPPAEAEAAATKACYIVQEVACQLWRPIPSRSKDYIVAPKPNGYQSLHLTLQLGQLDMSYDTYGGAPPGTPPSPSPSPPAPAAGPGEPSSPSREAAVSSSPLAASPSVSSSSTTSSYEWDQLPYASTSPSYISDPRVGRHAEAFRRGAGAGASPAAARGAATGPKSAAEEEGEAAGGPLCLELQIRTTAMDTAAESGDSAHAVYKGGLDARTARQLQVWTQELQRRLAAQPRGRLLLRAATSTAAEKAAAEERRRRRRERRAAAAAAAAALAAAQAAAMPIPVAPAMSASAPASTSVDLSPPAPEAAAVPLDAVRPAAVAEAEAAGPCVSSPRTPVRPDGSEGAAKLTTPPLRRTFPTAPLTSSPAQARAQEASAFPPGTSSTSSISSSTATTTDTTTGTGGATAARTQSTDARAAKAGDAAAAAAGVARRSDAAAGLSARGSGGGSVKATRPTAAQPQQPGQRVGLGRLPSRPATASALPAATGKSPRTLDPRPPPPTLRATSALGTKPVLPLQPQPPPPLPPLPPPPPPPPRGPPVPPRYEQCPTLPQPAAAVPAQQHVTPSAGQPSAQPMPPPLPPPPGGEPHGRLDERQQAPSSTVEERQKEQLQLAEQQRLMLFSSLGSVDEVDDPPLLIGLGQTDAAAAAAQLFRHLDVNGDGRLSLGEVRQVLMDLAAPSSDRDAAALMAALDRNGDGGVSMEEFVEGLSRAQQHQHHAEREQQDQEQQRRMAREEEAAGAAPAARGPAARVGLQAPAWQPWQHL